MPAESPIAIVLRHGRTSLNNPANPRVRAWINVSLSREGELDAYLAAQQLKKYRPKMVYSSDLERDRQTAEIVSASFDRIPHDIDFALRTANMGEVEGKTEKETLETIERWYKEPYWQIPGGETNNDFLRRFYPAFDNKFELARTCEACKPSIIVTHGRDIAALHARSEGIPQWAALMPFPGGMGVIYLDGSGRQKIEWLGATEPVLEDA